MGADATEGRTCSHENEWEGGFNVELVGDRGHVISRG